MGQTFHIQTWWCPHTRLFTSSRLVSWASGRSEMPSVPLSSADLITTEAVDKKRLPFGWCSWEDTAEQIAVLCLWLEKLTLTKKWRKCNVAIIKSYAKALWCTKGDVICEDKMIKPLRYSSVFIYVVDVSGINVLPLRCLIYKMILCFLYLNVKRTKNTLVTKKKMKKEFHSFYI